MRLGSIVRLVRPVNALIAFLAVITGAATVTRSLLDLRVLLGAASAALVLMSGNAVNDVFDVEADRVNRPNRPLPRGELSLRQASSVSLLFAFFAVALALSINLACFLVALFYVAIFYAYAAWLKPTGLLGNVAVSSGTGMSIVYGSLAVDWVRPLTVLLAVCAFMLNLGREIVKGVEDLEGDKARNCGTIALRHGSHVAGLSVAVLYLILLPVSLTPFLLGYTGLLYVASILAADLVVIAAIRESLLLRMENASKTSRLIKISMVMGIMAFLIGAASR